MNEVENFSTNVETFVADNFETFFAMGDGANMTFASCLDSAVLAFEHIYDDDTVTPNAGSLPELDAIYMECQDELDNFNTKVL